ncbi:MAG: hypothetical protein HYX39_13120 [Bacteroidetes bacterium]|nr:hypothetical protein [Bacteroidota bacterium]
MNNTEILTQIISKGGLIGSAAKFYLNDKEKTDKFILECAEQCHSKNAVNLWGEELVKEIIKYRNSEMSSIGYKNWPDH